MSEPRDSGRARRRGAREGEVPGRPLTPADLGRLGGSIGLCGTCRHARAIESRTSLFVHCARAWSDPAFPRYPRLPVLACAGYEPGE